ncbi:MAG: regulatory protein RecX [Clostridiales bacterium]|jgi:regulatory protein|nr:regulatory protein RecX [Clostridiales bacterium]
MTITELREITAGKFIAGFSDGSEMRLGLDIIADLSLFKGRELSDEELSKIKSYSEFSSCRERALRIIGARPMSCKELFDRLLEKGETAENAEKCTEWLIGLHYLDDAQYADTIVRHYAAKGYGIQKIKNELYRRGVPKTLWDDALSEMPETDDKVYELLCRKLKSDNPDRAEMKKATDALYRRGFSWDEIKTAVNRFNAERSDY